MYGRDLILTGIPRSGTTLACHLLNQLPNTVALHEPMSFRPFGRSPDHRSLYRAIAEFFERTRQSIRESCCAPSKQAAGHVPDNPVQNVFADDGRRRSFVSKGSIAITKPLDCDFRLVVKHPAAFTALLATLHEQFPCWAIVRHPLSVLASWNSVAFPVRKGRAPIAERLDPSLGQKLDTIRGRVDRQLHLLSWFFAQYRAVLPPDRVIRYEDLIATRGAALGVIVPDAAALEATLDNRNANALYDRERMSTLAAKLKASAGAYWEYYSVREVDDLLAVATRSMEAT